MIIDFQPVQVHSIAAIESTRRKKLIMAALWTEVCLGWVQLICELQRDWNRDATVPGLSDILFTVEGN